MISTLIPVLDPTAFTASTTCDRCGAAGVTRIVFSTGQDLIFCGHHDRTYAPALAQTGTVVVVHPVSVRW